MHPGDQGDGRLHGPQRGEEVGPAEEAGGHGRAACETPGGGPQAPSQLPFLGLAQALPAYVRCHLGARYPGAVCGSKVTIRWVLPGRSKVFFKRTTRDIWEPQMAEESFVEP